MNDDEHLLSRISTISALYNKLDHCLDSPGLELAQFLRELGFQASQAADYVDQRLGSSPLTPTTTQLPATAPAPLVTTPSAPAPIVATPAAPNTTQAPPIVRTGSTRGRKTSAQISQQRYDSIIAHIPDKIDPLQLKEYLSATHDQPYNNKTHAHLEDEAFSRLLRGYEPGTDEIWDNLFHPVPKPLYADLYIQSRANDNLPLADGLHKRDLASFLFFFSQAHSSRFPFLKTSQFLHQSHLNQTIDLYISFVFRSIEIIKFTKQWNNLESMPLGRSVKKDHLLNLFKSLHIKLFEDLALAEEALKAEIEQRSDLVDLYHQHVEQEKAYIEENLRVFKGKHCRVITARNTLLSLYTKFGNAILLDPIWDATSHTTSSGLPGRSESFRALVALFCQGDPVLDPGAEEVFHHITTALAITEFLDIE